VVPDHARKIAVNRTMIASAGMLLMTGGAASAQFDHLQCYKIDSAARVVADVDLAPAIPELPAQAGCRLKGPKLFCGPVAKTIIRAAPPAAGAPPGPEATSYLCYKARCDQTPGSFQVTDQFATYSVRSRKSFLLCAPARVGPPTTTTTTIFPTCGVSTPTCGGTCPVGEVCVPLCFGPGGSGCGCVAPPVCGLDGANVCGGNCPPACFCFSGGTVTCGCVCA
jgi:hypothetical protein